MLRTLAWFLRGVRAGLAIGWAGSQSALLALVAKAALTRATRKAMLLSGGYGALRRGARQKADDRRHEDAIRAAGSNAKCYEMPTFHS